LKIKGVFFLILLSGIGNGLFEKSWEICAQFSCSQSRIILFYSRLYIR
jgi:hypothetical protein